MPQWQPGSRDRRQISGMMNGTPVVGQLKMGLEALTGRDLVAGTCLGAGERLLNAGFAMLPAAGGALERAGAEGAAGAESAAVVKYSRGFAVAAESGYDWALMSPMQRAQVVVEKYGINLRGSGQTIALNYDSTLPPGISGCVRSTNPTVINFGPYAVSSEEQLARTIAHELRHARAFLGSGSNTEFAARLAEGRLARYINGYR